MCRRDARQDGVLRGCILNLVEESGCPVSLPEVRVLTDFIATAIAEGVADCGGGMGLP